MKLSRKGFTLAEVLITIGIIGVVAALTIPNFISRYKKHVVGVRLKQFATVWRQATKLAQFDGGGELIVTETVLPIDPDTMMQYYQDNWGKYLKTVEVYKTPYGISGTFENGSAFYLYAASPNGQHYLVFCPHASYCREYVKTVSTGVGDYIGIVDSKNTFVFYTGGSTPTYNWDGTRTQLLTKCKNGTFQGFCTALIEFDNWVVKDDYPHRF